MLWLQEQHFFTIVQKRGKHNFPFVLEYFDIGALIRNWKKLVSFYKANKIALNRNKKKSFQGKHLNIIGFNVWFHWIFFWLKHGNPQEVEKEVFLWILAPNYFLSYFKLIVYHCSTTGLITCRCGHFYAVKALSFKSDGGFLRWTKV